MSRNALRCGRVLALLLVAAWPGDAAAQRLDVSITPATITFSAADPDAQPVVFSAPVTVTYRVRQNRDNSPWTLTVSALGDLNSGASTVDITNVTWVATPAPPFQNGTLSRTVAQRVASGLGNVNPAAQGQLTFRLANSWSYDAGIYTQVIQFTMTSP